MRLSSLIVFAFTFVLNLNPYMSAAQNNLKVTTNFDHLKVTPPHACLRQANTPKNPNAPIVFANPSNQSNILSWQYAS